MAQVEPAAKCPAGQVLVTMSELKTAVENNTEAINDLRVAVSKLED